MISTSPLYSFKGEEPARIPNKIRLPDGSCRTDSETFTIQEIEESGYTGPYYYPNIDITKQTVSWDSENLEYIVAYLPKESDSYTEDQLWENVRASRDFLLTVTDWCVADDSPITDEEKIQVSEYRQLLRDWPSTITDPRDPEELQLPIKPSCIENTDNPTYHTRNFL